MDKQYQLPSDFKSENYSEPYSIRVETLEDFKENVISENLSLSEI